MLKLSDFKKIRPITKGWSKDKKYCVWDKSNTKYLYRISPIEKYHENMLRNEMMLQVAALDVPMCVPVEFGICDQAFCSIQTWINGKDATEIIPTLNDQDIYDYGVTAGQILRKIHTIPTISDVPEWEVHANSQLDSRIQNYLQCPLKYDNGDMLLDICNSTRSYLKNRPQCFRHGDYHIGNFMIDDQKQLSIIDFGLSDFGDPWEEFNRIIWCVQVSPLLACGMVNGYFNNNVPPEFWNLLALYISSKTIYALPWAIPYGNYEINVMKKQAAAITRWYENKNDLIPCWYREFP